jgi:signal transduction histidine kinase
MLQQVEGIDGTRVNQQEEYVVISVHDTGIGIKDDDKDKLFKPFSQLHDVYTKEQKGTGLGLTLSKSLVELHKGIIWFTSTYTKGSTFSIALPYNNMRKHNGIDNGS